MSYRKASRRYHTKLIAQSFESKSNVVNYHSQQSIARCAPLVVCYEPEIIYILFLFLFPLLFLQK